MDEDLDSHTGLHAPAAADITRTVTTVATRGNWRRYWRERGQSWRTEPEIDGERQQFLEERRTIVVKASQNIYPFKDIQLSRADLEWLLVTHESGRGPVDWSDVSQRKRTGLDLRGANLRGANLRRLPLARMIGGLTGADPEHCEAATVHVERADLRMAHLEGADLPGAHLEEARLDDAHAEEAQFSRAWLTRASCQKVYFSGANFRNAQMEKADLFGAFAEAATFSGTRLPAASLSQAHLEATRFGGARLEGAFLRDAYLAGAKLYGARMEGASLEGARLEGVALRRAHLEGANIGGAGLGGASFAGRTLAPDELERIRRWKPDFPATLTPADLRLVFFDAGTVLQDAVLGDDTHGYVSLADIRWGDVNLALLPWSGGAGRKPIILGEEREARERRTPDGKLKRSATRIKEFEDAVRANRQLALVLQAQGLNEDAARFGYRAQVLQRAVLRRQGRTGSWLFSHFLDALAGYGYRPGRSLAAYLLTITFFALGYYLLGQFAGGTHFSPDGALVFSLTSFHGRGFFPGGIDIENPITKLAAVEALFGLIIEISFIATFTQRFFGK
ncbi:MAG: hypothetical protein OJF49_001230 [Ktedonobacterales bacterium]|jgi:uncharacterized protein YjbI with pentapeptide repeats|nr:MAG: hypothetical protein OJF49_001230 [Ktedonobacterales bacterium]